MTTLEAALALLAPLGTGTGALAVWLRTRGEVARSREQSATAVVGPLLERVDTLEERLDKCEERHASCERQTSGLHERVAVLEGSVSARDATIRELRASLAQVRRSMTPPDMPAQREPRGGKES